MGKYVSWGMYSETLNEILLPRWHSELTELLSNSKKTLAVGKKRSYGDVCLNSIGSTISMENFDCFILFDKENGVLECMSGVSLQDLNQITVPSGWMTPVTPGTQNVTLGGMVANDVHGKNHHKAGAFGNYVMQIELLRTDGTKLICNKHENTELLYATIGGLGLTGIITRVMLKLKKIPGAYLDVETLPFHTLSEFEGLSKNSDVDWEYTVAWLDASHADGMNARGIFYRANHHNNCHNSEYKEKHVFRVPVMAPKFLLSNILVSGFNFLYFHRNKKQKHNIQHYNSFFYPLDRLENWNVLYGKRGFFQYQFVVPLNNGLECIEKILRLSKECRQVAYLSVLKKFGDMTSQGILSFPRQGYTLAIDFPNLGLKTLKMFDTFDDTVLSYNGVVYPAKDARLSSQTYKKMYPEFNRFKQYIDTGIVSDFLRRIDE